MRASILKVFAVATLVILGTAFQAQALTIDPAITPTCIANPVPTCLFATGNETSQSDIDTILAALIGLPEIYKQNVGGGSDTGAFAGSYTTTFSNTVADPSDALIHYVGGPVIGSPAYLLIKDGNQSPAWYLYRLVWNGTDDIILDNFWPAQGAISHVAFYGGATTVPDGGSMTMLLGIGLMGLAGMRRFLA